MNSGVYIIQHKTTGKVYVGSSGDIRQRWYTHKCSLKQGIHYSVELQKDWDNDGEEGFSWSILTLCDKDFLLKNEEMWTEKLSSCDPAKGYNNRVGWKHTQKTKKKMSEIRKGKAIKHTQEAKKKMSKTHTGSGKGYSFHKRIGKYRAQCKINKKHIHLGYYDTPEEARAAYLRFYNIRGEQ